MRAIVVGQPSRTLLKWSASLRQRSLVLHWLTFPLFLAAFGTAVGLGRLLMWGGELGYWMVGWAGVDPFDL